MRHVFVATPLIGPWLTHGIARFAFALGQQDGRDGLRFTFRLLSGSSCISFPVEFMRNRLVKMALDDASVTHLWFIDSDTVPPNDALKLLLPRDADIVAGVYRIPDAKRDEVWSAYASNERGSFSYIDPLPVAPFEAAGAGTGAMVIARRVLENPALRFAEPIDGVPCVFRTPRKPTGEMEATDDLDFCRRARAAGYRILVDPSVRFGHVKTRTL